MAINGAITLEEISPLLESQIDNLSLWIKGLGAIAVVWVVYGIITFFLERKKMKDFEKISHDLHRLEKKIDASLRKR